MQRYTIYLFLSNALHVSGGISAHHQELKTVYTASGTCQNLLLPAAISNYSTMAAGSSKGLTCARCWIYSFELLMMGEGTA
jgi:hypothetical protein